MKNEGMGELGGDIEHRVSATLPGDLENHSAGCYDLARFRSFRRH